MAKRCHPERSRRANQFLLPSGALITEHPILFQTEMVKANLEDRKTQTRRTRGLEHVPLQDFSHVEYSPECWVKRPWIFRNKIESNPDRFEIKAAAKCPYGEPGDLLWVKETWANLNGDFPTADPFLIFKADLVHPNQHGPLTWKPSIHLPKTASRIWAMVEDIRVERVQDISEEDARAEGILKEKMGVNNYSIHMNDGGYSFYSPTAKSAFEALWCYINGQASWNSNPWVWVIQYRILSKTGRPSMETIAEAYEDIVNPKS